ncbi:MAG: NAD(P)-dependent oxidoreductase, partial [Faecalicoccus sp.]|nr:NAD(P)-dependent oxidoreductase [Faecalicoccus sp.]
CEKNPDEAYRVNAIGARNLAIETAAHECRLIQFSTDDVFDGRGTTPLNEFDRVDPISIYGKSKLAGEMMIQLLTNKFVIIRSSWVYGTGHDFLDEVLKAAKEKKSISVSVDEKAVPTSAIELARVISYFIENDLFGLYHVVCQGSCSRYEYAKEIKEYAGLDLEIIPVTGTASNRPVYTVLDNMMLRLDGVEEPKEWKSALHEYLDSIKVEGGYEID